MCEKVFVDGGSIRCLEVSGSTRKIQGNRLQREEKLFEVGVQFIRKVTKNYALDFWSDGTPPQRKVI